MTSGSVSTSPNPSSSSISLDVEQTKSDENVTAEESEKAEQEISYYKSTSTWYWYTSFLIDQANRIVLLSGSPFVGQVRRKKRYCVVIFAPIILAFILESLPGVSN